MRVGSLLSVKIARMRWSACGLVVAILAGTACGGGSGKSDGGGPDGRDGGAARLVGTLQLTQAPLDVLFVIDDSPSMKLAQDKLLRSFPAFMTQLDGQPGLPSLHVAVVSQDMGAGDGSIPNCNSTRGKKGIFQYTARGSCAATNLKSGATYIENAAGATNYTGDIADVFSCIAALGETGCSYTHQFAALTRALGIDNAAAPAENQGFLRPDAILAIIMVTRQDDCSAAPGTGDNGEIPLFDTSANKDMASQLGPLGSFRCNEFGHTCPTGTMGQSGRVVRYPDRNAPNNDVTAMVDYADCASDDIEGYLYGVHDIATRLKALKTDPAQVVVVSIQGAAEPYTVTWKTPTVPDSSCGAASCPWPQIAHSCTASDGSSGDPGVRTQQFTEEFGDSGLALSICADDFTPSMNLAGTLLKSRIAAPCLPGLVGANATMTGPDCTVTEHYQNAAGMAVDTPIPACADNGNTAPCWKLTGKLPACAHGGLRAMPDPAAPDPFSVTYTYDCAPCSPLGGSCYQ